MCFISTLMPFMPLWSPFLAFLSSLCLSKIGVIFHALIALSSGSKAAHRSEVREYRSFTICIQIEAKTEDTVVSYHWLCHSRTMRSEVDGFHICTRVLLIFGYFACKSNFLFRACVLRIFSTHLRYSYKSG